MTLTDKSKRRTAPVSSRLEGDVVSYNVDVFSWAIQQATLLRERRFDLIDADHIADEINDVAHYLADKLRSDIARVFQHLLKWDHQPTRRSRSWMLSIREHRRRIDGHLRRAPGLRSVLVETVADAYASGRDAALAETDLPEAALPDACPYSWDEIMTRPVHWPDQS